MMKMVKLSRRTMLFALIAAAICNVGFAAEPKDTTAVIAAWNVKGIPQISSSRAKKIALGIAYLDAEVIVLTEVAPHSRIDDILTELQRLKADYGKVMPPQTADLGIAILHKSAVQVTDASLIPGSDAGNSDNRKALTAKVKIGEFDFVLVGVHLKSGGSNSSRTIRNTQCESIATFLETATSGAEKDVMVVGDYNMIPRPIGNRNDEINFQKMNPNGFLEFVSRPALCTKGTHISGGSLGNFLDGWAVSKVQTDEYLDGSIRVFPLHKTLRLSLSLFSSQVTDHLPLVARFDVVVADDD